MIQHRRQVIFAAMQMPPIPPQELTYATLSNHEPEYWRIVRWFIAAWALFLICRHCSYWAYMYSVTQSSNTLNYFAIATTAFEVFTAGIILIGAIIPSGRLIVYIGGIIMIIAVIVNGIPNFGVIVRMIESSRGRSRELVPLFYAIWQFFTVLVNLAFPSLIIVLSSSKRR